MHFMCYCCVLRVIGATTAKTKAGHGRADTNSHDHDHDGGCFSLNRANVVALFIGQPFFIILCAVPCRAYLLLMILIQFIKSS